MEILQQLRSVYQTLERVTVVGGSNIENMYGAFYGLSRAINALEVQIQQEQLKEEESSVEAK